MTTTKRPIWVYVAGPYSAGDQVVNVRTAVEVALDLLAAGLVPICPHLTMLAHLISPRPYETWMGWDAALLERCDAILRLEGESSGADREVALARTLGIPVVHVGAIVAWRGDAVVRVFREAIEAEAGR